jgi:uncharacterized Zn-finger protein
MDTICRACLSAEQDMEDIFKKRQFEEISEILSAVVAGVDFTIDDDLPKNICQKCLQSLLAAYGFCQMCKNSDESLRNAKMIEDGRITWTLIRSYCSMFSFLDDLQVQETLKTESPLRQESPSPAEETTKYALEIEVLEMSDIEIKQDPEPTSQPEKAKKRPRKSSEYLCSICGKKFSTNQRMKNHHLTHTGEKKFKCTTCRRFQFVTGLLLTDFLMLSAKTFATKSRIRSHERTHTGEKPYKCDICTLSFAQGNALKCHLRTHTGEKPYECNVCGKRFSQNTILKTHMSIHIGKNVKCELCDKKFSRPSYLILHRREHSGEKPYVCHKCPNRYMQKSHLDRHLDTHLGIKHKCHICNKEYTKSWSLKVHLYTHTEQSEHPFHCEICQMSFIRRKKYSTHMKQHENDTLVEAPQVEVLQLPIIESYEAVQDVSVVEGDDHIGYIIVQQNYD